MRRESGEQKQRQGRQQRQEAGPEQELRVLPNDIVIPLVDGKEGTVAVGSLSQCPGDVVVMVHHAAEHPVHVVEAVEGRLVSLLAPPNDRKPFARLDQFGADQKTGDEAVEFLRSVAGLQLERQGPYPPQPRLSALDPRRLQAQKSLKKILTHTNCGSWAIADDRDLCIAARPPRPAARPADPVARSGRGPC